MIVSPDILEKMARTRYEHHKMKMRNAGGVRRSWGELYNEQRVDEISATASAVALIPVPGREEIADAIRHIWDKMLEPRHAFV